ncbi:hypothetical protein [Spongiimicrobium salis]|uniref:hypothetical protein n=1 Tax=Spongiimicrobium salis TaxID=1667022 RepID=UPI00374DD876
MQKIIKIVLVVISLIGAVLWFQLPSKEFSEANPAEAAKDGYMAAMFMITYILLGIAVVVSVFFTLKNLFSNPAGLKKALYVIGALVVVVVISFALASGDDVNPELMAAQEVDETVVKRIGVGLNVFFILTIVAVASMVLPGVKKLFSK